MSGAERGTSVGKPGMTPTEERAASVAVAARTGNRSRGF
ncbi:hypothetical protein E2C01_055437 [Portunus trituberculatus]|uniref:Uncharacterized protein n=1 Tax=Portunus trituberculatus TaxID=210409 RepID=A0A5B7GVX9_PORTR|nr:hypothetical protein [Portunus trituberculatus]